jgi:hypothetical protein
MVSAQSGWESTTTCDGTLLDNAAWTTAVKEFCSIIGHELPGYSYDTDFHGQYFACHVEKKLALYFVLHFLSDEITGTLSERKLRELRRRETPLEAMLTITKPSCPDCDNFLDELQDLTGIIFHMEICHVIGQTEPYRDGTMTRRRLVAGGTKELKLFRSKAQENRYVARQVKESPIVHRAKDQNSNRRREIVTAVVIMKNPNIMVILPSRPKPSQASQRSDARKISPPATPVRPTRSNGLFTPPSSPFSFDTLDKINRRRRYLGKGGSPRNPFVLR